MSFPWFKGHGTENDFVLLPDHDGTVHGSLDVGFVAALCDRRRGIGADGVIRVIRTSAVGWPGGGEWFMDYRNADGSISEMCGNGVRVFARHVFDTGLAAPDQPLVVSTRDGDKIVTAEADGGLSVDMGPASAGGISKVSTGTGAWEAHEVHTGNPHAVALVDSLEGVGDLHSSPSYDDQIYPQGVNIEFVERRGHRHVGMRVFERGSGETRSCGTGACAVGWTAARLDGALAPVTYRVDVPGGTVHVTWRQDDHLVLTGPAEIVAGGTMEWFA